MLNPYFPQLPQMVVGVDGAAQEVGFVPIQEVVEEQQAGYVPNVAPWAHVTLPAFILGRK